MSTRDPSPEDYEYARRKRGTNRSDTPRQGAPESAPAEPVVSPKSVHKQVPAPRVPTLVLALLAVSLLANATLLVKVIQTQSQISALEQEVQRLKQRARPATRVQ